MIRTYLKTKPIYFKREDKNYFFKVFNRLKSDLVLKNVIQIVGTNGKGSTGRFLTQILRANGLEVGHFSSPHIFDMSERFFINDKIISYKELNSAHKILSFLLSEDEKKNLSYFEYLTLLCGIVFKNLDYVVLEAGVGGELDATSLYPKKLSLFTPIGLDHLKILGSSLKEIATTKFKSMSNLAILNDDMDKDLVLIAKRIALINGTNLSFASSNLNNLDLKKIKDYIKENSLANFLCSNLILAASGAKKLGFDVKLNFKFNLLGRCELIRPNLIVDVGHNEMCSKVLSKEAFNKFNQKYVLIYNSFDDKDIRSILFNFLPYIKRIEIFNYESENRKLGYEKIVKFAKEFGVELEEFSSLEKDEKYLVFGSFKLVENFILKECS